MSLYVDARKLLDLAHSTSPKEVIWFCGSAFFNCDFLSWKVHTFSIMLNPLLPSSQECKSLLLTHISEPFQKGQSPVLKMSQLLQHVHDLMHSFWGPEHVVISFSKVLKLFQWEIFSIDAS